MVDLRAKPFYLSDKDVEWVEQTLAGMTLEEKIGQLFIMLDRKKIKSETKKNFDQYHIGGCRYENEPGEIIYEQNKFYQESSNTILNVSKTSRLIVKVETRLKEKGKVYFSQYLDVDEYLIALALDYVISGMFSVYRRWLQNGRKISADEVAKNIGIMSLGAVNAMLGEYCLETKKNNALVIGWLHKKGGIQ